jgi:hypothetical protein
MTLLARFRRWLAGGEDDKTENPMLTEEEIRRRAKEALERKLGATLHQEWMARAARGTVGHYQWALGGPGMTREVSISVKPGSGAPEAPTGELADLVAELTPEELLLVVGPAVAAKRALAAELAAAMKRVEVEWQRKLRHDERTRARLAARRQNPTVHVVYAAISACGRCSLCAAAVSIPVGPYVAIEHWVGETASIEPICDGCAGNHPMGQNGQALIRGYRQGVAEAQRAKHDADLAVVNARHIPRWG